MLPQKIVFVDVETTGMRGVYDRIIEVGVLRVEDNVLVKTFQSLVNPDTSYLPAEIISLTGITPLQLESAPSFYQIKDELLELFDDCVLVAHNVRFDYGFLKNEFKRVGVSFSPKHFCTVKLSKELFPQHRHHNLDAVIQRMGIECSTRHRAFDDAKVLWDFYSKLQEHVSLELLASAVNKALKRPSLPSSLPADVLDNLPETSGVYIFYGDEGTPLYVGKSVNVKDRVLSHFASDYTNSKEMKIAQQVKSIETITTSGELGALLLEATLVKKMQPLYNRQLRLSRRLVVLISKVDSNGYMTVGMEDMMKISPDDLDQIVGIFRSQKTAKETLRKLAKEHQLCERLLKLEATNSACFGYRLGRCNGACVQKETSIRYNMRFLLAFSHFKIRNWPFDGAIIIEEKNPVEERVDSFVINNWCYVGTLNEVNAEEIVDQEFYFDHDTYKIIDRYLRKSQNLKNIKLFRPGKRQVVDDSHFSRETLFE